METGFKVGDAMTKLPVVVVPDTSIVQCSQIMDKNHVGALVVKDSEKLVGIVTEQDIVRDAVAKQKDINSPISEIMEKQLTTITP
jgi:CBS domain-containing protein